jgi:hypothetical protein
MLFRICAVGAMIFAVMVAIKDGRVLRATGLTGSCAIVQTASDGTQVEACRPGKLQGRPDLTRDSCKDAGQSGSVDYWRCPAAVASGP